MSLNMYLGEVHMQTQSMNAVCTATIQGMEQAIQSIDAFAIDTVLQGQTYSSAKSFFVQTFRPLAQGIIYLCEELIRQNDAFPSQFQSQVASTDVIEQELLEQIREIDRMKTSMEAISQAMPIPGIDALANLFTVMRKKLQEKLEHLHEFNYTSSSNYDTALQLAASIAQGLAEVQSGKGFSPASGTFSIQELNMEWTGPIQAIRESKAREAQIEKAIALREQEANRPWYEKTAISTWEFMKEFFQGAGSAAFESVIGLESPDNDELESKLTYQSGRFAGNVVAGAASIIEILEGLTVIGGANFLTFVAEVGTGGLASPIVLPLDAAATAAGLSLAGHGVFVGRNAIQNGKDTLQKFQSSSNGTSGRIKEKVDANNIQKSQSSSEVGNSVKNTEKIRIVDGKKQYNVNGKWVTDKQFSALRQKAVRHAWRQEKELIKKTGKGTRDWTPAEKLELLQTGKVKGYEGQHMKSANEYPDFAGEPDNIQFLKGRNMDVNEHFDAHRGNYHNPTNGYYTPKNDSMTDFGDAVPWKHE
ncbi:T7SS effector LXG polymorphic toxin [Bacillus mycoides]|uniref:Ribonuclease n=1 Tax=Bacillus mycoides TaxID=1405 RepID=A0AAP8GWQ4_BACMY|nr:T7SS effector LXG polymorphic toxin [Bacillus mycoides]PJN50702.1 Ribonuclease [Bacillus mycoides]PJN70512.1 Ribonuclease [Bacillus mycoides]